MTLEGEIKKLLPMKISDLCKSIGHSVDSSVLEEALKLYNSAVKNIQSKSEDIASIELRKALSICPEFQEAEVLLGLCYLYMKQIDQAEIILKRVTERDDTIAKAYQYLRYIEELKQKYRKNYRMPNVRTFVQSKETTATSNKGFLKMFTGFIFGVLIAYLILHNTMVGIQDMSTTQVANWNRLKTDYDKQIAQYNEELTTARNNTTTLQQQLKEKSDRLDYLENVRKLLEIENMISNGEKEQAADMLFLLKNYHYGGVEKQKFDALYSQIISPIAKELYYKGYGMYEAGNYDKAVELFTKSLKYDPKSEVVQAALYFAGRSYQKAGDRINATVYFNRLINEFPGYDYAIYASNRLTEMQNSQ